MSYFRSYFEKNNTILINSDINTAKNVVTEIYYGNGLSRFIFKINLEPLKTKINNGDLVLDDNTKHYLNLTNTIFGDKSFLGKLNGKNRKRATSFDLILFPITDTWDEGTGFDYEKTYDYTTGNETFDIRPSNWKFRTTLHEWSEPGIYEDTPSEILSTIHFDNGNENINVDITEYINELLSGTTINNGIGLSFHPDYNNIKNDVEQSVAFFSKYTQTFFEPYLESVFSDTIIDNRNNFTAEIENNLFLYIMKSGNNYDLDETPVVDILDDKGLLIPNMGNLSTIKIKKGVYKVTFSLPNNLCDGKRFFRDVWKNIVIDGKEINNITQRFIPNPFLNEFNIGSDLSQFDRYVIQFYGVKLNEKIKRGEIRKIIVNLKSIKTPTPILTDKLYYRIYVKEGKTQVNVFEWTQLEKTTTNFFMLDTSFLIPREYYLEIKSILHNEEIFYNNEIKFEIISEK